MHRTLSPGVGVQPAIPWSLPLPLLIEAASVVVLLVAVLLVWRWRRHARPTRVGSIEAPELTDLRTAETMEDLRFCTELARSVGGPVLELGSGTGRIALELARRGLAVTALDSSRWMLQWAKTKAEQLAIQHRVEWIESELTSFTLDGRKFKLILASGHVLQRVGDQDALERCLGCVVDHLEPDGTFVAILEPPRWGALSVERRYLKTVHNARTGELVNVYHSLDVDLLWQQLRETYTHEIWDQRGHRREVVVPFAGSYLTCPQMALLLRSARMQLEAAYGSFAREPLTVKSRQMIFVARLLPDALQSVPASSTALGDGVSEAKGRARSQRGAAPAEAQAPKGASGSNTAPGRSPTPALTRPLRSPASARDRGAASGAAVEPPAPSSQAASDVPRVRDLPA